MRLPPHPLRYVIASVALLALPLGEVSYLQAAQVRRDVLAAQQVKDCQQDQRNWETTHKLVSRIGEPSPAGNAITRLVIPPETPGYVRIILAQLAEPLTEEQKADIRAPFYATQGPRPTCNR